MRRLLIVNSSEVYALALARRLCGDFDVRICTDGALAPAILGDFQPDILILHTAMPRKDSLSILREMPAQPSVIIATTNHLDSRQERRLLALGVQQILLMPTVSAVVLCLQSVLSDLDQRDSQHSAAQLTAMHLHILNFQTHLDGYHQLCVGLPMGVQNPRQPLTKELYPAIAKILGVSDWRAVEHSIRKAIFRAWQQRDDVVWGKYFPPDAQGRIPCPSNKQFISRLIQMLSQELDR